MSRSGRIAIALAALALGGAVDGALHLAADPLTTPTVAAGVLGLLVGWSFVGAGLVAWARRPENRTGPLLVLVGFLWFVGRFEFADDAALHELGAWVRPLHIAVFAYLLLAFPAGRLESRPERALAAVAFVNVAVLDNAPELVPDDGLATGLFDASRVITTVVFLAIIGILVWRWRAGTAAWRRAVGPLLWPGALSLASLVLFLVNDVLDEPLGTVPGWIFRGVYALFPLLFLAGLLRTRLARASVARLVLDLERAQTPAELEEALARALGDPSLAVAYWLPEEKRYVDAGGRPTALPRGTERRVSTLVEREGRRVAAVVHDEALADEPELLQAVAAAAALALDNTRLQAELRARLDELRASRARIVEAADLERKRIERNLHDSTQQRLTSVALGLGLAETRLGADPESARALLEQAKQSLTAALAELRDLSQGIHPSVLAEGGLGPALEDLAYTTPFPVTLATDLNGRLPEHVEAGAYYVVAEALTNVAKHARASGATVTVTREDGRLRLSVRDDGVGGADPGRGTGLRGLADRVEALGGTLEVESGPGGGTELVATIPCA